jgi:hypothetical protein
MTKGKVCEFRERETRFCLWTDLFLFQSMMRSGLQVSEILDIFILMERDSPLGLHLCKAPDGSRPQSDCFEHMVNLIINSGRMREGFSNCLSEKELWSLAALHVSGSQEENAHVQKCEFCWRHVSDFERVLRSYAEIRHIRYS